MKSIAIDGPSGSGKSTVAKALAEKLGMLHLDTGAMYRMLAWKADAAGIPNDDTEALEKLAGRLQFSIEGHELRESGAPLPAAIRVQQFAKAASVISAIPGVRKEMQEKQKDLAIRYSLIMDGRDIGTCVIPETPYKFYLDANVEERARRRYEQGEKTRYTFEEVLVAMKERDTQDMNRAIAPLTIAEGAIVIDNTNLSVQETVDLMMEFVEAKDAL